MLDLFNKRRMIRNRMTTTTDKELIARFIKKCVLADMTLAEIGAAVGRTKAWASHITRGETVALRFQTRNRMLRFLGAHQ